MESRSRRRVGTISSKRAPLRTTSPCLAKRRAARFREPVERSLQRPPHRRTRGRATTPRTTVRPRQGASAPVVSRHGRQPSRSVIRHPGRRMRARARDAPARAAQSTAPTPPSPRAASSQQIVMTSAAEGRPKPLLRATSRSIAVAHLSERHGHPWRLSRLDRAERSSLVENAAWAAERSELVGWFSTVRGSLPGSRSTL